MEASRVQKNLNIITFLRRGNYLNFILEIFEIIAVALAFQCAWSLYYSASGGLFFSDKEMSILFMVVLPFWILVLYLIKVTKIPTKHFLVLSLVYLNSAILIMIILIITCFLLKLNSVPILFLPEIALFGFLFLYAVRIARYLSFKKLGAQGYNQLNIVVIADDSSQHFIESNLARRGSGYRRRTRTHRPSL